MNKGPSLSDVSWEPWRNAFSASEIHKDHLLLSLLNNLFAPDEATLKTTNSLIRLGVGLSRVSCRRSGSLHPIKTTRHFGRSLPMPRALSLYAARDFNTRRRSLASERTASASFCVIGLTLVHFIQPSYSLAALDESILGHHWHSHDFPPWYFTVELL